MSANTGTDGVPARECQCCGAERITAGEVVEIVRGMLAVRGIDASVADERARNIAAALNGLRIGGAP